MEAEFKDRAEALYVAHEMSTFVTPTEVKKVGDHWRVYKGNRVVTIPETTIIRIRWKRMT